MHPSCSLLKVTGKRKVQSTVALLTAANLTHVDKHRVTHKKRELLKNPTKIEEIQEKNLLTEIEPLKLAF